MITALEKSGYTSYLLNNYCFMTKYWFIILNREITWSHCFILRNYFLIYHLINKIQNLVIEAVYAKAKLLMSKNKLKFFLLSLTFIKELDILEQTHSNLDNLHRIKSMS